MPTTQEVASSTDAAETAAATTTDPIQSDAASSQGDGLSTVETGLSTGGCAAASTTLGRRGVPTAAINPRRLLRGHESFVHETSRRLGAVK